MISSVKNNEISAFQCWKKICSKLNKFKLIHWNVYRFPNSDNLKVKVADYFLSGCFHKNIQLFTSDWVSWLSEVSLATYTMDSVFLPL